MFTKPFEPPDSTSLAVNGKQTKEANDFMKSMPTPAIIGGPPDSRIPILACEGVGLEVAKRNLYDSILNNVIWWHKFEGEEYINIEDSKYDDNRAQWKYNYKEISLALDWVLDPPVAFSRNIQKAWEKCVTHTDQRRWDINIKQDVLMRLMVLADRAFENFCVKARNEKFFTPQKVAGYNDTLFFNRYAKNAYDTYKRGWGLDYFERNGKFVSQDSLFIGERIFRTQINSHRMWQIGEYSSAVLKEIRDTWNIFRGRLYDVYKCIKLHSPIINWEGNAEPVQWNDDPWNYILFNQGYNNSMYYLFNDSSQPVITALPFPTPTAADTITPSLWGGRLSKKRVKKSKSSSGRRLKIKYKTKKVKNTK